MKAKLTKEEARERQLEAKRKYMEKFDKISVRLERGTIERIKGLGYSTIHTFVVLAIQEKLDKEYSVLNKNK